MGILIRMTGDNPKFAKYLGINTKRVIVLVQVFGAMIAAFGGATFLLGNSYRFTWKALPNYGFDGFVVAILLLITHYLYQFQLYYLAIYVLALQKWQG